MDLIWFYHQKHPYMSIFHLAWTGGWNGANHARVGGLKQGQGSFTTWQVEEFPGVLLWLGVSMDGSSWHVCISVAPLHTTYIHKCYIYIYMYTQNLCIQQYTCHNCRYIWWNSYSSGLLSVLHRTELGGNWGLELQILAEMVGRNGALKQIAEVWNKEWELLKQYSYVDSVRVFAVVFWAGQDTCAEDLEVGWCWSSLEWGLKGIGAWYWGSQDMHA